MKLSRTALSLDLAIATLAVLALTLSVPANAQSSGAALFVGTWGGSGRISYTDGSSEAIRCSAYNSGGGSSLKLAIQCKSEKNPIHIRSQLTISGSRVSGQWEERTFNVSGTASGTMSSSGMTVSISGGGFNGGMNVSAGKSSLTISITTQGIAMNRASMNLSRQ